MKGSIFVSHPNFGIFPFEYDLEDLNKVMVDLEGQIILIGNSTGCQVIMTYINRHINNKIVLCILQGSVSDTEYFESQRHKYNYNEKFRFEDETGTIIDNEVDNKDIENIFRYDGIIYIHERYVSLYKRHGIEDLFSSYLEDEHYKNLNKNNYKLIFVISDKDEFVVKKIDDKLRHVKNSEIINFREGDHFLHNKESQKEFIKLIKKEIHKMRVHQ
ncbi:alpha/beta-hydrolases superfamily protein [Vairimorpha necatrix]|uniref:Alpha/beta-hydrolases superfamily protein n=1 Tax=Vairimorpha necatrix TaxID=6039 RepID=A0AAX4J920_9MICR